jgi:small-conductance mechanosensitive channel
MTVNGENSANDGFSEWLAGAWENVLAWFFDAGETLIQIAVIIVGAWLLSRLLRLILRRVVKRIVSAAKFRANVEDTQALEHSPLADIRLVQRTRTMGTILQNIANVVIGIGAVVLCIYVAFPGILSSFALITAALGAGLGFGAQNIVKDTLNGLFIVAGDQIGIGDVVDLGLASGIVESVSVRVTRVRDVNGTLWYVRNGEITRVGNMSQGWARAIVDVGVPAGSDLGEVETALLDAAKGLATDRKWRTRIIENPEVWGLESVEGDTMLVRVVMRTRTITRDDVAAELRKRLLAAMAELGVEVPKLVSVSPTGQAAAQRVRGSKPPITKATAVIGVPPVSRGGWRRKPVEDHLKTPAAKDDDQ